VTCADTIPIAVTYADTIDLAESGMTHEEIHFVSKGIFISQGRIEGRKNGCCFKSQQCLQVVLQSSVLTCW
jgi:hypothetical protein